MRNLLLSAILVATFGTPAWATVEVVVLPETVCTRTVGAPNVCTFAFPAQTGRGAIAIRSNASDNLTGARAAVIRLNGVVLASPASFQRRTTSVGIEVGLASRNTVTIEMRGIPGSTIAVRVTQSIAADAAAVVGPSGATLVVGDSSSALRGVSVAFGPGALDTEAVVTVSSRPQLELPRSAKTSGGHLLAFDLKPEGLLLHAPAELRIPYPDGDSDGFLDGIGLPVECLKVFSIPESSALATRAPASIDTARKEIVVSTQNFSAWDVSAERWIPGSIVNYFVQSVPTNSSYPHPEAFFDDIDSAQRKWSNVVNGQVRFRKVTEETTADVVITTGTVSGAPRGWQVSTSRPRAGGASYLVTYNQDLPFAPGSYAGCYSGPPGKIPFLRKTFHEWGHVIGLPEYEQYRNLDPYNVVVMWDDRPDSSDPEAYACALYYDGSFAATGLNQWDINRVRALYPETGRAILFSNFGPGDSHNNFAGVPINGPIGQYGTEESRVAMAFVPPVTSTLETLEVPLFRCTWQSLSVQFLLLSDDDGRPGSPIETFEPLTTVGYTPEVYVLTSTVRPVLEAGTRYWIVGQTSDVDAQFGWNFVSIADVGLSSYWYRGAWSEPSTLGWRAAFRITGVR